MFPCKNFQVLLLHLLCMYLSHFLGMSKVENPSPHASMKQKGGSCHSFLSELDPHPECNKCLPNVLEGESLLSQCPPLPGREHQQSTEVLFDHEGAQGGIS